MQDKSCKKFKISFNGSYSQAKRMSHFSNQLRLSLERNAFTQTLACERSESSPAMMSRYVSGENRPEKDAFEKIASIFPREDRRGLLLAYLLDDIPDSLSNELVIQPRRETARVSEDAPPYRARMAKKLREAHDFIGQDAMTNEATADWLIANHERLKGK